MNDCIYINAYVSSSAFFGFKLLTFGSFLQTFKLSSNIRVFQYVQNHTETFLMITKGT